MRLKLTSLGLLIVLPAYAQTPASPEPAQPQLVPWPEIALQSQAVATQQQAVASAIQAQLTSQIIYLQKQLSSKNREVANEAAHAPINAPPQVPLPFEPGKAAKPDEPPSPTK